MDKAITLAILFGLLALLIYAVKDIYKGISNFTTKSELDKFTRLVNHELALLGELTSTEQEMHKIILPCFITNDDPVMVACHISMERN